MAQLNSIASCIICRENVPCESIEHVLPETIGGAIKIKICETCNHRLGKRIDTPFVNSDAILALRHKYSLSRGNRSIKNPFAKKELKDEEGRNYYVEIKDGLPLKNLKPIYQPPVELGNDQYFITVTMPEKDVPKNPLEILNKIEKLYEIEIPNKETYIIDSRKLVEKNESVKLGIEDLTCFFEFLKITYELGCIVSKDYFLDPKAKAISEILHKGALSKEEAHSLYNGHQAQQDIEWFHKQFQFLKDLPEFIHTVIFTKQRGKLQAYIRIFNFVSVITLSEQDAGFINSDVLIFNDAKEGGWSWMPISHLQLTGKFQLTFNKDRLSKDQNDLVIYISRSGDKNLVKKNGRELFFLESGEEAGFDIFDIAGQGRPYQTQQTSSNLHLNFEIAESNLFVKHETKQALLPVKSIQIEAKLI